MSFPLPDLRQVNLVKFDPDSDVPIYIGINADQEANDGDNTWLIWKLTYSGTDVTAMQKRKGNWTDRVALFP